jgi:hypothetical protein
VSVDLFGFEGNFIFVKFSYFLDITEYKFWFSWQQGSYCISYLFQVILGSSKHIDKAVQYDCIHPWLGTGLLTSTGM